MIDCSVNDIRRLDHVWRYSSIPVVHTENVAQHSFYVVTYAILIHQQLRPNDSKLLTPVIFHALTHDMIESKTGDVVRTFKYLTQELKQEIDKAEELLIGKLDPIMSSLFKLTKDQMTGWSPEGHQHIKDVVKAADFLSLFQYMRVEAIRGNAEIIPFYNRMIDDFTKIMNAALKSKNELADFYVLLNHSARVVINNCFSSHTVKVMDREV